MLTVLSHGTPVGGDIGNVLLNRLCETMVALVIADKIQVITIRGVHRCRERCFTGIANGPWRQTGNLVCVVG